VLEIRGEVPGGLATPRPEEATPAADLGVSPGAPQGAPFFAQQLESNSRSLESCARCQQADRRPGDSYCRACRQAYTNAWRHANPERTRELQAQARRRAGIPERKFWGPRPELRVRLKEIRRVFEALWIGDLEARLRELEVRP